MRNRRIRQTPGLKFVYEYRCERCKTLCSADARDCTQGPDGVWVPKFPLRFCIVCGLDSSFYHEITANRPGRKRQAPSEDEEEEEAFGEDSM